MLGFMVGYMVGIITVPALLLAVAAYHKYKITKMIAERVGPKGPDMRQFNAVVDQEQLAKIMAILGGEEPRGPVN